MLTKKVVVVLVIIAVVLALIAVSVNMITSDKKVSTDIPNVNSISDGSGEIGVVVNSPEMEDKGTG